MLAFGDEWRSWRDSVTTKREWLSFSDEFINKICRLWGLPQIGKPKDTAEIPQEPQLKKQKQTHTSDDFNHDLFHSTLLRHVAWFTMPGATNTFALQTDCHSPCEVLMGRTVLQGAVYADKCEEILSDIHMINSDSELNTVTDSADPIIWLPRRFNVRADEICNTVLDQQKIGTSCIQTFVT